MEGSPINTHLTQQNRTLCPAQHRSHGDEARTMPLMTWNDPRFPLGYNILPNSKICEETNGIAAPLDRRTSGAAQLLRTPPSSACKSPAPRAQHLAAKGSCIEGRPGCAAHGLCSVLTAPAGHISHRKTAASDLCPPQKAPRGQWEASVQHSPLAMKAFKRDAEQWAGLELKGGSKSGTGREGREGGRKQWR